MERLVAMSSTPEYRAGDLEADAAYYRVHFGATLESPDQLEQVVRSLRANFTPDGILKAREIEDRLMNETWLSSEYDLFPKLARLRIPTLLIHGEHDLVPVECARRIAEAIPGARFVLLGGVGHFSYLEAPNDVRKAIVEFLA
jgi:proline iminopeptidase